MSERFQETLAAYETEKIDPLGGGFLEAPLPWIRAKSYIKVPKPRAPVWHKTTPLPADLSIASGLTQAQKAFLLLGGGGLAVAALLNPTLFFVGATTTFLLFFAAVIALRLVFMLLPALIGRSLLIRSDPDIREQRVEWPDFSIFVALYQERDVLPILVNALEKLDYPRDKLDIKLICEAGDDETLETLQGLNLDRQFELVIVPDSVPKTKPKALNHALPRARGQYLVIYDAEDKPDPDQLKRAVLAFEDGPQKMACVQARLGYFNDQENWLTRMFTIEYAVWFELILPGLRAMKLPIPLGGTSIHFKTDILRKLGGWDAHNVTEDADLGVRLARRGYHCGVLDSTTDEEANCQLGNWIRQRSRWIKGYMQTWAVHMRHPVALWTDVGSAGFFALQLVLLGTVISAVTQPVFWGFLIYWLAGGTFGFSVPMPDFLAPLHTGLLIFGTCVVILSGMLAISRAGKPGLMLWAPSLILYWPLAALAAYRALWQFFTCPFYWEKTRHGLSRQTAIEQSRALVERTRYITKLKDWSG